MQNYDLLIERIVKSSGLEKEEVERRVEAKKAKLSGLISKEGAAQIIAAELGVNFEDQDLKISELLPGMRKVNVVGKIIGLFPVREYEKNGKSGKVANFRLGDETGNCRVVLWDANHIEMIENGSLKEGDVVEIKGGSTRDSEIHLSSFSELKKSEAVMEEVVTERVVEEKPLAEVRQGQLIKTRAVVVQMFPARFYSVCPECNKKVTKEADDFKCAEHGVVVPKQRGILNLVLDDGTENMRFVLFSDQINSLVPEEDLADAEKFEAFKKDLLGTELYISGRANLNQFFNNVEVVANSVEKVDVEKLVEKLEQGN